MRKISMIMIMVMRLVLSRRMTFQTGNVKLIVLTTMLGEFLEVLVGAVAEGVLGAEDVGGIDQGLTLPSPSPRMDKSHCRVQ